MAHHRNRGGRGRQGNTTPQNTDNLIQESVENEENEHPVADSNRMMLSMFNESNKVHKHLLKEEHKMSS
jgi:hypothetical protein